MSSTKGKSNAPWNECIGQMKGQQGVSRRNAQADSLRLDDFLGAKFKGTNYKIGTSPAFQVGNRYGIDPDLLKGVKKIPSQYIIASSGQVLDGENTGDIFGWSTDLSEDGLTLAVGSILNDNTNGTNSGSVRVYARSDPEEAWVQKGIDIDGEAAQDYSGWAIALSADGDRLVVGAVFNDDGGNINTGHVRIYDWNAGTSQWVSVTEFNGGVAGDFFGYSVSLSRDKTRLAVGAPYGLDERGYVSVYEYNGSAWQHVTTINGVLDEGRFGKVVALNDDGSRLVVSAPHALGDTGVVYFYDGSANLLAEKTGPGLGVKFGHALDLRGHTLAVADITSAPLKIFDMSSDTFVTQTAPTGIFRSTESNVKLSQDGNVLLFSMPAIDTEDNVINSTAVQELSKLGLVKIFARDGDAWKQRGWDMKSYASNNDEFGKSINLSGDGLVVCISAPRKDDFSTDRGCVTAYTVRPISYYVKPTITLLGLNPQPMQANTSYVEAGAVTDTGAVVTIVGDIEDNSVEGQEYTVRYTAASAFETTIVERTIVITKDPTVPVLTLNGDILMEFPIGGVFNDPGASSNIPASITTDTSGVDFQRVGEYEIKYTAVSGYGISSATLTRRILVVYDFELETVDLVGRTACLSKDGFIAGTADFVQNTVKLYEWNPITPVSWKQIGQTIRNLAINTGQFGASLDLSTDGLTVAIGAPGLSGLVRVYRYDFLVNAWEQKGDDITGVDDGDKIGDFLCISGDGNVVSTGSATPTSTKNPYVFCYRYSAATDSWTKFHEYVEPLKLPSNVASKPFSGSLNSSGDRLLLGAPVNNYTTGAIFLFDLNTDQKLVSIFGDAVGAYLGQSVKLTPTGDTFVYGDVSAACVKVYAANAATGFWGQMGESITESYSSGGEFGKHVDISSDGTVVTFSDPSTASGRGKICQYAWDALNSTWRVNMVQVKDNITGSFFGRKFYVTEDASKILTESSVSFQYYRWKVARPQFSINGTLILRLSVDQEYDNTGYVSTPAGVTVTVSGVVDPSVTKDYFVKYTMTNDLNLSEVAYQIVSVSGGLLQLGFDVTNFDASSTPVNFGRSASMSSDGALIAVGAPGFDGDTGMVKIYQFNPATVQWDLQATVLGPSTGSSFGYSVSLSKDGARLAIGAPDTANGLVRVYAYSGTAWNQIGSDLIGMTPDGKFGFAVALNLDGSQLTVGEPRRAFDVNTGAGAVRTYEYVTQWTEVSSMVNNQLEHELGHGVAITSTTNVFLAGAPMAGPGYVKLSSYGSGNIPIFAPTMVFGEKFGWSVSISDDGHTFAVGAPYYNDKTGRVLVFDATTTPPSPKGSPILGETPLLEFGLSVHVSGNGQKLMVYAGNGRVSTFQFTNSQWTANTEEIITSSETNAQFGYALASSGDGRRMLISTPLQDLVQVYSTETTQITNADFVGPILSLNGPVSFIVSQGSVFTDPGVRRDDGGSDVITTGSVDVNTLGTYNLTYSAVDDSGNPSQNTLNRAVTVVDTSLSNNLLATPAVNSSHNNNNACVQMSSDGTRFAVASGAPATTYVSDQVSASTAQGLHGSVVVYEINESSSPITFAQVDEITDVKPNFATAIQMNQDGTRIAAMHTLDSSSAEISVYEVGNAVHTPFSAPFTGLHGSVTFGLPTHSSIAPITGNAVNLFGRSGDRQSYRYKNLATSSDGTVVAIGKPASDGTDRVSVYRNLGTVAIGTLDQQGSAISPTGLASTHSDISSAGERIVFCADETTFIYAAPSDNALPWVKEAEFTSTDNVNAVSDDGSVVAFSAKPGGIAFLPINLVGGDRVSIARGAPWSDPGYTYAGTDTVTVTGTVDTSQTGEYIIQYQTSTNTQIRIVSVGNLSDVVLNGYHHAYNVPSIQHDGWHEYEFDLFTVPSVSPDLFEMSITLNTGQTYIERVPNTFSSTLAQHISIFTSGGFLSSIAFSTNVTSASYDPTIEYGPYLGVRFTNHTRTTTIKSGSLSSGDVIKGRLRVYGAFYPDFEVNVTVSFQPPPGATTFRIPSITLTGLSENSISTGEDFVDPGFTSDDPGDTLSTYISPTFPPTSCRKAIVYRAVSSQGIVAYAVRYVEVGERSYVAMYQFSNGGWSQLANIIVLSNALDLHATNVALSESGNRVAISKYVLGQGSIFTYEYSDLTYPPTWVQYGSAIEITKTNRKPGFSLALSGDGSRLVIGSPGDANNAGEAYVYDYGASGWVKKNQDLWSLTTSNFTSLAVTGYSMDLYGHAVDISKDGTHVAVGSPLTVTGRGHVSVYTLSGENFILKGNAIISSTEPEFGRYVSITDTGLDFVTNAGASASSAGRVVQYRYLGNSWYEFVEKTFTVPVTNAAISESGNKILSVTDVVEVYVVTESQVPGGQWEQLGIDIDLASIAAPGVDTNPSPSPGSRYSPGIFKPTGNANITGYAVDLSHDGMVLAIGLPFLEIGGGDPFVVNSRGAAAVFNYDGTVWNQVGGTIVPKYVYDSALTIKYDGATSVTVLNEIAEANTFSGAEVSISGDGQYICVGSPGYLSNPIDIQSMDSLPNEGGMTFWTLYRRNESYAPTNDLYNVGWEPVVRRDSELSASLSGYQSSLVQVGGDINSEAVGDRPGWYGSVSMSSDGTRVAIGAYLNDGTGTDAGHVRVYEESGGTWTQVGADIDGEAAYDQSGWSVSMSSDGTRVAIGAYLNDGTGLNAGHVRVYAESGGTWTQVGSDIDGEAAYDQSGYSVSMSSDGTRVAIGAIRNDGTGSDAGHVRVYYESGGTWTQVGSDIDGEAADDYSGISVSMSSDGTRVAIGAYSNDSNGNNAGHVRVYAESGGTWTQVGADIDGEAANDRSGYSVSMSSDGTRVAIAAYGNDGNTGHVRVYDESGGTWTQVGADIDGEAAGDSFGRSVSLSSNGKLLVISAPGLYTRVYFESGGTWTQLGLDIDGRSVSISSDGGRVATGDFLNDRVRVYSIPNPINEKKRELLGLGLKVSSDGSFVVFDTRTDGVKILTESSGVWSVHGLLDDGVPPKPVPATTDFLVARNMLNPPAVNTTYTQQPSAAVGYGNFPAKYWPVSYISLSTNDKYLSVSNPLLDPLDRATSTNDQQVSDLRLGRVTVFKSSSSTNFTMLGTIVGDTDAYTWGVDDFAYSHSTISDNGLTMVIPSGVIPSLSDVQDYKKQISIYDFDREADVWGLRVSSVVDGTEVTSSASFPDEYNFMTVLSKDRSTVTSLYLGPTQPVFRQYLVSTTFVQSSYNKVSTLSMASQNLNAQPFPLDPLLPNERIADFAMSDDGIKIAIGNARGVTGFTTINADKEMGSVSVFTYDTTSEEWGSQVLLSVPDTSTYVNSGFVSAQFGTRVKFLPDGNTLVVSAPTSRDGLGDIFFFDTSSTTAIAQKTIPYANPSTGSQGMFGSSLGISDDYTRLFVGDPGHDSGMGRIAVVEYEVSSSSWSGTPQYITRTRAPETYETSAYTTANIIQVGADIEGEAAYDYSGYSVSMSSDGTRVAIGATGNDGNGTDAGHVRVYEESGGTWTQVGADIDGEAAYDNSGYSVSMSSDGKRVAIGAINSNGGAGHVRVYAESGGTWTQVGSDIDGEVAGDKSGLSVSMSSDGMRVAIGAYFNDGNGTDAGHVRVYEESGGTWTQVGSDIDGEAAYDRSGSSVSLSSDGTRVAIGAYFASQVRVYEESGGTWTKVGSNISSWGRFGNSVSLSSDGTRVAIGAPDNSGNGTGYYYSGQVRVFAESGGTWTQVGSAINGEAAYDESGWSVSLSSDGKRVAIGAILNDGNGSNAGHVRVYDEHPLYGWTQVGADIDGEAADDQSGWSVSISANGSRVAIGALYNDWYNFGPSAGHVRVYSIPARNRSFNTNLMFGRDFDVTRNGERLISSFLGKNTLSDGTLDNTVAGFNEYFTLNSGLEMAEVFERDAAGVWGLDSSVPNRLKIEPQPLQGTGMVESLVENTSIRPTVKISGTGLYSMFGIPSLKKLSGGLIDRQSTDLNVLINAQNVTPVISLVGDSTINFAYGTLYTDPGVVTDMNFSDKIVISGDQVDVNVVGTYVVRYTVTRLGSLTNFVERTFNLFVPSDPPTVTLLGSASVSLLIGNLYTEPDPPATFTGGVLERYGDPPSGSIVGTFRVRYVVRNNLGIASAERVITVEPDTTPPVITILGGDVVHKFETTYRDPSYIQSDGNEDVFTTTPAYLLTSRDIGNYLGTTQVTYSATDQVQNVGTTVRNVTVKNDFETTPVQQAGTGHSSTLSSTGNRVAVMDQDAVSIYETGGALVNSWTGLGSLEGQMVKLNSDGTVVAFTTTAGVYVYEYTTSWVERPPHSSYQRFTVPGSSAYRIELSDDGDTLAVSYPSGTTAFFDEVAVFRWNATAYDLDYNQGSTTSIGSMSLNSTGTRLVLGYPNETDQIATTAIVSGSGGTNPPPTLNGVTKINPRMYRLTTTGQQFQNNTMYWQINLGSSWTCSWIWEVYGPGWHGDDMRLIYFAPNPITASQASVHGGWNNYYRFSGRDTQQIRRNDDAYMKADFSMYYGHGSLSIIRMTVNYDNGVMTSTVHDYYGTLLSSISYDFGGAHQHLYGTPTYFGFSGKTGYFTSSQYIQTINLSGMQNSGVIEVFDRAGPASWSQVGSDINGGKTNQKLGTVVKISGDGSTILNINEGRDGNDQKLSVFTLNSGTWTKNTINAVERTFDTGDGNDLADISDDGSFLVYAKGTGTELYATHPEGLASKYLDGFKLDGGVYRHVLQTPVPSAATNRVALAGDASRVLVLKGEEPSVFDVTETVFDPIITLNESDGLDTLTVVGGAYTEQGATSNVTDGSSVTVGGDTVTATPGTYRVTYSVTDSNTGRSGFRSRVVIVT